MLGRHATFFCNIFFYFICFFCVCNSKSTGFFFKSKVETLGKCLDRVGGGADIMHCGNYRNKMNACRFESVHTTNEADKCNGNENFITTDKTGGWFLLYHLHTLDNRRWRFSKDTTVKMFNLFTFSVYVVKCAGLNPSHAKSM